MLICVFAKICILENIGNDQRVGLNYSKSWHGNTWKHVQYCLSISLFGQYKAIFKTDFNILYCQVHLIYSIPNMLAASK